MLTYAKCLTFALNLPTFLTSYLRTPRNTAGHRQNGNRNKKIRIMKKIIIAAAAALFMTVGANAQSVNNEEGNATIADVVAQLGEADAQEFIPMYQKMLVEIEKVCGKDFSEDKKTAKIDGIIEAYYDKFSYILDSDQNEVAMNTIPFDYIEGRTNT